MDEKAENPNLDGTTLSEKNRAIPPAEPGRITPKGGLNIEAGNAGVSGSELALNIKNPPALSGPRTGSLNVTAGKMPTVNSGNKLALKKRPDIAGVVGRAVSKVAPKPVKDTGDVIIAAGLGNAVVPVVGTIAVAPVVIGKIMDSRINKSNNQKLQNFAQELESKGTAALPQTKKRISWFGAGLLISIALIVDVIEFILTFFPPWGQIINIVLDILVSIIFVIYAMYKGLTLSDNWAAFSSLIGTMLLEAVPLIQAAPFFSIDAIVILKAIHNKDKAKQQAIENQARAIINQKEEEDEMDYQMRIAEQNLADSEQDGQFAEYKTTQQAPQSQKMTQQEALQAPGRLNVTPNKAAEQRKMAA